MEDKSIMKTYTNRAYKKEFYTYDDIKTKLKRNGDANMSSSPIKQLPNYTYVPGNVDLRDSAIEIIGDDVTIGGDLILTGTEVHTLGKNLIVGGTLYIENTKITNFPINLVVGGDIKMQNTNASFVFLPDTLRVGGHIYITDEIYKVHNQLKHGDRIPNKYLFTDKRFYCVRAEYVKGQYTLYRCNKVNVVGDGTNFVECRYLKEGMRLLKMGCVHGNVPNIDAIKTSSHLSKDDMITLYCNVTGEGVDTRIALDKFINGKYNYSLEEMVYISEGYPGHDKFTEFVIEKNPDFVV